MYHLAVLIPAAAYVFLTLAFTPSIKFRDLAEALVKAHLCIFMFVAISTELLSVFAAIRYINVFCFWIIVLAASAYFARASMLRNNLSINKVSHPNLDKMEWFCVGGVLVILIFTFITSIIYPTNIYDSMTYHMARIVHWISNESVRFYTTEIARQNYMMPLAEYAIMHLQILTASDLYANLVQWVSFLVMICLGYLIAAELGSTRRQRIFSAVVVATIPMAILQASSTQTDLVVSAFILAFAYYMMRICREINKAYFIFAALSLGLALLTKGTAFLFCAGVGLTLGLYVLLKHKSSYGYMLKLTAMFSLVLVFALILNAGYFYRNYEFYGTPVSPEGAVVRNNSMSVGAFVSNLVRNTASHLGTPLSEQTGLHIFFDRQLEKLLGPQLNNPDATFPGTTFNMHYSRHEGRAGNLIHMLVILASFILLPSIAKKQKQRAVLWWYAFGIVLGAGFYAYFLSWQPWGTRLHTPFFAMYAPLIAITLTANIAVIKKFIGQFVLISMIIYGFIFTFSNAGRSLVSLDWHYKERYELYFSLARIYHYEHYKNIMDMVHTFQPDDVGLFIGSDDWEYPFWAYAYNFPEHAETIRLRHVGVTNSSKEIDQNEALPDYVIAKKDIETWEHADHYVLIYSSEYVILLQKALKQSTGGN